VKEIVMDWQRMGWLALAAVGTTLVLSRAQAAAPKQDNGFRAYLHQFEQGTTRFPESGARPTVEYVTSYVSGDLAYTVAIERSTLRPADQRASAPMNLRVTHVFRREDGQWRLIHRHADPLLETTSPDSVLAR
jgi:ketosteroid isomerase-like protein